MLYNFSDLKAEKKIRQREHRILLLGCGEAGKSTFIKQMRIIHSAGFTNEERLSFKRNIASNILSAIQVLLANSVDLCLEDEEDARRIEAISERPSPEELIPYVKVCTSIIW